MVETHYVKSGETSLAYRAYGAGALTLLHVPGAISNIMMEDLAPPLARYFEHLSRFCRVVRFDKRGTGLSDRSGTALTLVDQLPDVEAVQRAIEAERVVLYGLSQGAAVAVLYALAYPERVSHLILVEGLVSDAHDPREPRSTAGNELFDWDALFADIDHDFGPFSQRFARTCFPEIEEEELGGFLEVLRGSASPSAFRSLLQGIVGLDLRQRLKELAVPTLVLHARGDQVHPVEHGRYLAAHVPSARYVELDCDAHVPYVDDAIADQMLAAIEEFLTGSVVHSAERRFATVLFTDIVDSTARQQRSGDEAWRGILSAHHGDAARLVEQFGGRVVELLGDGVLAAFAAPGEGLRAARALLAAAHSRGIQLRAGLQAGEVYETGDRLLGICVNTAARVAAEAAPDEILTTELVQGLVEGSGFRFSPAGEFELKGIGPRRLLRLL